LANIVVPLLFRLNSEKLSLPVSIESPREAIESEERESVEFLACSQCLIPLLAVDECLFLEVYIFIKSIIVKLRLLDLHCTRPLFICLLKHIEYLNNIHNHILLKNIFDDNDRDILLEL
jgi:hypothetical protein